MKNNEKPKSENAGLIKNVEQAKLTFDIFFEDLSLTRLEGEISDWVTSLPKGMKKAIDALPQLFKQDSISWLVVPGNASLKYKNGQYIQIAAVFSLFKFILRKCWLVFGKDIYEKNPVKWEFSDNKDFEELITITDNLTLNDMVGGLHFALLKVVGNKYHESFMGKMKAMNPTTADDFLTINAQMLKSRYSKYIINFGLYRTFLDALFFYLDSVRNTDNTTNQNADCSTYKTVTMSQSNISQPLEVQTLQLFMGVFAHEIRSQLTGIASICLYAKKMGDEANLMRTITSGLEESINVLDNLLKVVKAVNGQLVVTYKEELFLINELLSKVADSFEGECRLRGKVIQIRCSADIEHHPVRTDKFLLTQILNNLISNALKWGYRDCPIVIIYNCAGNWLTIDVESEGKTITEGKTKMLFEPFFQLEQGYVGAGLGLYISSLFMDKLKGTINVKSINDKTTFSLKIPQ